MYDEETVKVAIVAAIIFSRDPNMTVEQAVSKADTILREVAKAIKTKRAE